MKITSCDCYKKRFENLLPDSEIWVRIYKKEYPMFKDCYHISIVEKGNGVIAEYEDVKCCQFCGKKIEVQE